MMNFLKMHGLGNDFVILDQRAGLQPLSREAAARISDRHFGVGCDQLIILEPSEKADLFMRIYNPDGSEAESCGNATRCVADLVMKQQGNGACLIETKGGILDCRRAAGMQVSVDMGPPRLGWQDIPLSEEKDTLHLGIGQGPAHDPVGVNMGNPHCVFFVQGIEEIPIEALGPVFERHKLFPQRANISFAEVTGGASIRMRVWERGAGVTLACGSASCATIVAAVRRGLITGRSADIQMDGGALRLEWREGDGHVLMVGPVSYVFEGRLPEV
ncbi:MAG: diaminopimelate epimerase [Alphaproteobacteria bacterium]|jgi:diaminopimelate epimerase|nr:diaminopimelate epimerase [Alphaproteobacteria bacterium]QQS56652.1 MAG: diaminopimelate epimerase [Alphaproteobacteria bacterium]